MTAAPTSRLGTTPSFTPTVKTEVITGEREREIAYKLVAEHTPEMESIPADFERRLMAAVVTFELRVTRLEGKF